MEQHVRYASTRRCCSSKDEVQSILLEDDIDESRDEKNYSDARVAIYKIECVQHSTFSWFAAWFIFLALLMLALNLVIKLKTDWVTCTYQYFLENVWGYWITYFVMYMLGITILFCVALLYSIRIFLTIYREFGNPEVSYSVIQVVVAVFFFCNAVIVFSNVPYLRRLLSDYAHTPPDSCFVDAWVFDASTAVGCVLGNAAISGIYLVVTIHFRIAEHETVARQLERERIEQNLGAVSKVMTNNDIASLDDEEVATMKAVSWAVEKFDSIRSRIPLTSIILFVTWIALVGVLASTLDFAPSMIPFVGAITVIRVCSVDNFCSSELYGGRGFVRAIATIGLCVLELIFLLDFYRLSRENTRIMSRLPYHLNRRTSLPLVMHEIMAYVWFSVCIGYGIIGTSASPVQFWYSYSTYSPNGTVVTVIDPLFSVGIAPRHVLSGFYWVLWSQCVCFLAYGFLPADSKGLKGWIWPSSDRENMAPQVLYFFSEQSARRQLNIDLPETREQIVDVNVIEKNIFILQNELHMLNVSDYVYYISSPSITPEMRLDHINSCGVHYVSHIVDEATDTHVCVLLSQTKVVIGFRGTKSLSNVKTDLKVKLTKYTDDEDIMYIKGVDEGYDVKVHYGFLLAYQSVKEQLHEIVDPLIIGPNNTYIRSLYCTGHSLGGGIAVICAYEYGCRLIRKFGIVSQAQPIPKISCTTFGSPRVGTWGFALRFNKVVTRTMRFVAAGDVVTKSPPRTFASQSGSYYHVGTPVLIRETGDIIVAPSIAEKALIHGYTSPRLSRHFLTNYAFALMMWIVRVHSKSQSRLRLWPSLLLELKILLSKPHKYVDRESLNRVRDAVHRSINLKSIGIQTHTPMLTSENLHAEMRKYLHRFHPNSEEVAALRLLLDSTNKKDQ